MGGRIPFPPIVTRTSAIGSDVPSRTTVPSTIPTLVVGDVCAVSITTLAIISNSVFMIFLLRGIAKSSSFELVFKSSVECDVFAGREDIQQRDECSLPVAAREA